MTPEALSAIAEGERSLETGRVDDAVRAFQRAAREAPDEWSAHHKLGLALLRRAAADSQGAFHGMAARALETAAGLAPAEREVHASRIAAARGVEALEALRAEYRTGRFATQPFAAELVKNIDVEISLAPAPAALLATGGGSRGGGIPWFLVGLLVVAGMGWWGYRSRGRIASAVSEASAADTQLVKQAELPDELFEPLPGDPPAPRAFLKEDKTPERAAELAGHTAAARSLTFTEDGRWLISGAYDRTARVWSIPSGEPVWSSDENRLIVHAVGWDRLQRRIAAVDAEGTIDTWAVQEDGTIEAVDRFPKVAGQHPRLAFSPNGRLSVIANFEGRAILGDVRASRPVQTLTAPVPLRAAAFSPDGTLVALGTAKRHVICWDLRRGRRWKLDVSRVAPATEVFGLTFSPDGATLAVAYQDSSIVLLDMASRQERLNWFVNNVSACAIAFSPDGKTLATAGSNGAIYLWDPANSQKAGLLEGATGALWALAFSPDGETLAAAGDDGVIRLWR